MKIVSFLIQYILITFYPPLIPPSSSLTSLPSGSTQWETISRGYLSLSHWATLGIHKQATVTIRMLEISCHHVWVVQSWVRRIWERRVVEGLTHCGDRMNSTKVDYCEDFGSEPWPTDYSVSELLPYCVCCWLGLRDLSPGPEDCYIVARSPSFSWLIYAVQDFKILRVGDRVSNSSFPEYIKLASYLSRPIRKNSLESH